MAGCSKSEFGMVIVANRLQQLHVRRPYFRCSLSADHGCVFRMCCGVVHFAGCPVVDESEAISTFAAQDLGVRDRAAV